MGRLEGKVALVTGSGSVGMGGATAILFAKEGARVVVSDIDVEGGRETVRVIKEAGGEAIFVKADVADSADMEELVKTTTDAYGRLDILFNNAGIPGPSGLTIPEMKAEDWDTLFAVDVKGVFLGMKYSIPEMLKGGGGTIINNGSASGLRANPGSGLYGTAKAAVIQLTKVAALEFGAQGIRVNCICPFAIVPRGKWNAPSVRRTDTSVPRTPEEEEDRWRRAQLPMKRTGKTEEIAQAVLFLATDQSSWINGAILPVDGGSIAGVLFRFR